MAGPRKAQETGRCVMIFKKNIMTDLELQLGSTVMGSVALHDREAEVFGAENKLDDVMIDVVVRDAKRFLQLCSVCI